MWTKKEFPLKYIASWGEKTNNFIYGNVQIPAYVMPEMPYAYSYFGEYEYVCHVILIFTLFLFSTICYHYFMNSFYLNFIFCVFLFHMLFSLFFLNTIDWVDLLRIAAAGNVHNSTRQFIQEAVNACYPSTLHIWRAITWNWWWHTLNWVKTPLSTRQTWNLSAYMRLTRCDN